MTLGATSGYLLNFTFANPGPFRFFANDGKGNFSDKSAAALGSLPSVFPKFNLIGNVADFDGDGRQDVLIQNEGPDNFPFPGGQSMLWLQTPAGTLSDQTASHLPLQNAYTTASDVADVDGDGSIDILMNNGFGMGPQLYMNDGSGHFTINTSRLPAPITSLQYLFQPFIFVDINQDGSPDLVLGRVGGQQLVSNPVLLNDGKGNFSLAPTDTLPPRLGGPNTLTSNVHTADFDGDGWPDLLMPITGGTPAPSIGGMQLFLNNGDGTFRDASDRIPLTWAPGTQISRAIPIDINHDGWMDIFTWGAGGLLPAAHHLFLNTGGGHFIDASAAILPGTGPGTVFPGDFDGDGLTDFLYFGLIGNYTIAHNLKPLNPVVGPYAPVPNGPNLPLGSVVHAASFTHRAVAPGEIIAIFGSAMGPTSGIQPPANAAGQLATSVSGTSVLFDGVPAPLLYVRNDQINAIVPYSVTGKKTTLMQVQTGTVKSNVLPLPVAPASPGIFTLSGGKGQIVALNQDFSINSAAKPAKAGTVIVFWATGAGQTNPAGIDGQLATDYSNLPTPTLPVSVEIGGVQAQVLYSGAAPSFAGLLQLNVVVPDSVTPGPAVDVYVKIGNGQSWPRTTLAVQ
jgi:uncharacterized protein (TIGR03437 family)